MVESKPNFTERDIEDINRLLKQLSSNVEPVSLEDVKRVGANGAILVVRNKDEDKRIIGMSSLICFKTLTGLLGRIEDVVVDESHRGKGLGKRMTKKLIEKAKEMGIKHIDLTSSPHRVAANGLYKKLGFKRRETNIYRLALEE